MFKSISKVMVSCFLIIVFSIQGMEELTNNWEFSKAIGPLKELKFEESEIQESLVDNSLIHFGWLYSEEFKDHVYAAVSLHEYGYYVNYVDPEYKISLPPGFYYWKSLNLVKLDPKGEFDYFVVKADYTKTEPHLIPSIHYDEKLRVDSEQNIKFSNAQKPIYRANRDNRYKSLPSFKKAFDSNCSNVYLFDKIEPLQLYKENESLLENGFQYRELSLQIKEKILTLLPDNVSRVLRLWLNDKLSNTGLPTELTEYTDSIEYITNRDRVIDQFIIESIIKFIQNLRNEGFREKFPEQDFNHIDVYKILESIESLKPCSLKDRRKLEEARYNDRLPGMTAIGIIEGNPGILQWD